MSKPPPIGSTPDTVRRLSREGLLGDWEAARGFLADPTAALTAWLDADPTAAEWRALAIHLRALTDDPGLQEMIRGEPEPADVPFRESLAVDWLRDELHARLHATLEEGPGLLDALQRRDAARAVRGLAVRSSPPSPSRLDRLRGWLEVLAAIEPRDAEAEPPAEWERALQQAWPDAEAATIAFAAGTLAEAAEALLGGWNQMEQSILVPLAGARPGVVQLTIGLRTPSDPASASVACEVRWTGRAVAPAAKESMPGLIRLATQLLREHGHAAAEPSVVEVRISDIPGRPLDRRVRRVEGRSWEVAALLALLAVQTGGSLEGRIATGQVDLATGAIEAVGGIEEKLEALHAYGSVATSAASELLCPASNLAHADRAARRLDWPGRIVGVETASALLDHAGIDPWAGWCEAIATHSDPPEPDDVAELLGSWRPTLASIRDGGAEEGARPPRLWVLPAPFAVDAHAWLDRLAGWFAEQRRTDPTAPVPLVLPSESEAGSWDEYLRLALEQAAVRTGIAIAARTFRNQLHVPGGFVLLHAAPRGRSPIGGIL